MMGDGFAASYGISTASEFGYSFSGYWHPISWLVLLFTILIAFVIAIFALKKPSGKLLSDDGSGNSKYATFFGGEKSEHSMVGGGDLFWGMRHNLRYYFEFIQNAHTGILNDYALWAVVGLSTFIVYFLICLM